MIVLDLSLLFDDVLVCLPFCWCPCMVINVSVQRERRILIGHGDLPRQHPFGTTLRFTGPVPADSRQWTPSVRNCVTR